MRSLSVTAASLALLVTALSGCRQDQSALHPASAWAGDVATLFWVMSVGGGIIWLIMMGIVVFAVLGRRRPTSEAFADRFILAGGVIFPTTVLTALLIFGLRLLPGAGSEPAADLRIHVTGEQYWWRVEYDTPEGRFETANQIRLPLGATVEFSLTAQDVIHSFWIPNLGGKLDMIPGRVNRMRVTPDKPGIFRGVCAEFCGLSHALMVFEVEVMPAGAFETWRAAEAAPAAPGDPRAFVQAGCGACHALRGMVEAGSVGPDLTHFARRRHFAAGTLPLEPALVARWLQDPQSLKPGARMPGYADLPLSERTEILHFLMGRI